MFALHSATVLALALVGPAFGGVVINEVMYHAPNDLDDLQFVELHNTDGAAADISGWKLAKGVRFEFPAGTTIEANGFLVVCKDPALFRRHYRSDALGPFEGNLSHGGDRIDLVNGKGKKVDDVKYKTRAPWPVAADGFSSSLERICPTAPGDDASNWAPSPLPSGLPKPGGTPLKKNTTYSPRLLPVIAKVHPTPAHVGPGQTIQVEADVNAPAGISTVELRYRVASPGSEKPETTVAMAKAGDGKFTATVPGQEAGRIVRLRVRAVDSTGGERYFPSENEVCPAVSVYVHEPLNPGKIPLGFVINVGQAEFRAARNDQGRGFGAAPAPEPPPRGNSAYVHVRENGQLELFDFITVSPRNAGRKLRLHKHQPLDGMTTVNLLYEYLDRFVMAEPMAYELYRKAGNAACRTDFVRTTIDGRPVGFQLLVEQPNKAFLRHNGLKTDGNLYKCIWYGEGVVGQHEKKTNVATDHGDLVQVVDQLKKTRGDNQWATIKKEFDAEQFINYYAVNMVLSHWDGYFNNYFVYHDTGGTGKWTIYPWDQDKTWGYHDGLGDRADVFTDMPLTMGMQGDTPPGWPRFVPPPPGFGHGAAWWRPGGHFSKPMLSNATFRKHFLARTKDLVENVYTEAVFFPIIDKTGERLEDEARIRAKARGENPEQAVKSLKRSLDLLKEHLVKRRKFLLAQPELQKAGKFDGAELK